MPRVKAPENWRATGSIKIAASCSTFTRRRLVPSCGGCCVFLRDVENKETSMAHHRRRVLQGMLAAAGALATRAASADSPAPWRAGIAKTVITPEKAVWLAGYGSKRVPDGKLHDLWMKALALEDDAGRRVVLITSDFQGVPKV